MIIYAFRTKQEGGYGRGDEAKAYVHIETTWTDASRLSQSATHASTREHKKEAENDHPGSTRDQERKGPN